MFGAVMTVAAVAASSVPFMQDTYSILCKGDQATGFDWQNGEWVKTNFKSSQFIVVKKSENKCLRAEDAPNDLVSDAMEFHSRSACLNVRDFGKPYHAMPSERCSEIYMKRDKQKWEVTISCSGVFMSKRLHFTPDGRFTLSSIHSDLSEKPEDDYKDSLIVEVGRCSLIS